MVALRQASNRGKPQKRSNTARMDKGVQKKPEIQLPEDRRAASGKPGARPTWTSGAKTSVGTAAAAKSRIWFTVGLGTLNEIYYPDVDQANTRSIRFLISDGEGYFSDEAVDAVHQVTWPHEGVPYCRMECECPHGRYRLIKEVITDPEREAVLMRVRFQPRDKDLQLYLFVEPHLGDKGDGNRGWMNDYKGQEMLVAQRSGAAMAITATAPFLETSAGYIGKTDGLSLLRRHRRLPKTNFAGEGNIGLTARIDYLTHAESTMQQADGSFVVAIACGGDPSEAGQQARAGVLQKFDTVLALFTSQWNELQSQYRGMEDLSECSLDMYRVSNAVLETHQSKRFSGAFVASLSLPWGFAHTDSDVGGYHVTWPRDLVETAMGKLAADDAQSARSSLFYLACTQKTNGSWSQNMWLDGSQHWGAIQMDGIALPILLADQLRREDSLDGYDPSHMVKGAARFLLQNGPVTQQDRWEALAGFSPFTMATEVAALLAAADTLERAGHAEVDFLRQTADAWNDMVDEYTYVEETALARKHGISGYYIRIAPPERTARVSLGAMALKMTNRSFGSQRHLAANIISPDALALVRFGLRSPQDPRIVNTVRVIDATLQRRTRTGVTWTRSTSDGYGENAHGAPFVKHGIGRGWPLLAGERGHFELASGQSGEALELLKTMARQTSSCGMLPEQVWDSPDIPGRMLENGRPSGSGMPLVWAHAEYIKLLRSLHEGRVWDLPPQTVERYQRKKHGSELSNLDADPATPLHGRG